MTFNKKKSVVPIYGTAALWALYCVIFPLHNLLSFIILVCIGVLGYVVLSYLFQPKTDNIEVDAQSQPQSQPQSTGDEKTDTLLAEGEKTLAEMKRLRETIPNEAVQAKADQLINITEQIFNKLRAEPNVYAQVKRFSDFFLPTSVKLLSTYSQIDQSGVAGENITSTMERIDSALDMTLGSYKKLYDSLYENTALDIETDISVLETMLKKDGFLENDFGKTQSTNQV